VRVDDHACSQPSIGKFPAGPRTISPKLAASVAIEAPTQAAGASAATTAATRQLRGDQAMSITLTVPTWEKTRPKSAKGSGVAKALAVTGKDCKKDPKTMTSAEVKSATTAAATLRSCLKVAADKIEADKKDASAQKVVPQIYAWMNECTQFTYELKVRVVSLKFAETFSPMQDQANKHYVDCARAVKALREGAQLPSDKDLTHWMGTIRDAGKMTGKDFVSRMSIPEAKEVKVSDVTMPAGQKDTQAKLEKMTEWCIEMAKAVKRGARAAANAAPDTTAVDKEVKTILAAYQVCEDKMKPLIKAASQLDVATKALADDIKKASLAKQTDEKLFKKLGQDYKAMRKERVLMVDAVKDINITWRESTGDIAKRASAVRKDPGYDEKVHGTVIAQRMQSNMLGVRRATQALGTSDTELDRAERLAKGANNLRGYF
jgi:hypothetical protein